MKQNKTNLRFAALSLLASIFSTSTFAAVEVLPSYRGWENCYKISNETTEIIISPSTGGRVLCYALNGEDIIYTDHSLDGLSSKELATRSISPDAGRFDIGPESTPQDQRSDLFCGQWSAKILSKNSVELTYDKENPHGVSVTRRFTLSPKSSKVEIVQTMTNQTSEVLDRHYWGRTFCKAGGVVTLPLDGEHSKWGSMSRASADPAKVVNGNVESAINDKKGMRKVGTDSMQGWLKYAVNGVEILQKFKCYAKGDYSHTQGYTTIFFCNPNLCEIEPVGPSILLKPGKSSAFKQTWELSEVAK